MRERVLAIVSLIAQYFLEEREMISENDLVEELLAVGFDAEEIDAAFSWMESQALDQPAVTENFAPPTTNRVFTREENRMLHPKARGFLTRMRCMGLLDDDTLEEVIDKALQLAEDEVTLKEVKTITVLALFARSHQEWRREYDCLLEDDWSRLLN